VPLILALDTSSEWCGVALLHDDEVLAAMSVARAAGFAGHSEHVLAMVAEVLQRAGRPLADVAAIAFGAGPGAFTGLRVACAVTQGLALGLGCPVVPVDCLAAMALECAVKAGEPSSEVLIVQDARMGEVYVGRYRFDGRALAFVEAPFLIGAAALVAQCSGDKADILGGSALLVAPALAALARSTTATDHPDASFIGRLGAIGLAQGDAVAAKDAAPIYVRDRVALTIDERVRGVRLPA
jgi:tRNA threonylcarbamoyladenosine biosynthesis protein TsaB